MRPRQRSIPDSTMQTKDKAPIHVGAVSAVSRGEIRSNHAIRCPFGQGNYHYRTPPWDSFWRPGGNARVPLWLYWHGHWNGAALADPREPASRRPRTRKFAIQRLKPGISLALERFQVGGDFLLRTRHPERTSIFPARHFNLAAHHFHALQTCFRLSREQS